MTDALVRQHLRGVLAWKEAHVDFDSAVAGIPPPQRGGRPSGAAHSLWQIVEHIRIAQADILDFCRNPEYRPMTWPDDYWPADPVPPDDDAWDASLQRYKQDREALQRLALDPAVDLTAPIPHGDGHTSLREILLVADHTAYHVGELVLLRRLLGIWP